MRETTAAAIDANPNFTAVTGTGTGETQVLTLSHALKGDIAANDEKQPSFTYESFVMNHLIG